MVIRFLTLILSVIGVIVFVGCADNVENPVSEMANDLSETNIITWVEEAGSNVGMVRMAPQEHGGEEDRPSARLLAFFPEFFPDGVEHSTPLNGIFHGGPRKDGIPALTDPRTLPASAADYMRDTDIVLGMTINGESRAYPFRIMNWHEIVNDMLGGQRILVTYCPLCGTGIAFDPVVDGEAIEFGISGMLHNSDLLMYDRHTESPSLWQQALGEAVVGPKTGMLLDLLPITQTRWGEWKAAHPDTTVLSTATGHIRNYDRNIIYPGGFIVGELSGEVDARLDRTEQVLGVSLGDTKKAYPLKELRERQVVNDVVAGVPIVLIASPVSDSVRVYKRSNYQFKGSVEQIVEINTNSVWEISEEALANPVTGDSLERIPDVFVSFWFAWFVFHPDTLLYDGSNNVNIDPDARWFTTWGNIKQ